jgi:hypothetical protein
MALLLEQPRQQQVPREPLQFPPSTRLAWAQAALPLRVHRQLVRQPALLVSQVLLPRRPQRPRAIPRQSPPIWLLLVKLVCIQITPLTIMLHSLHLFDLLLCLTASQVSRTIISSISIQPRPPPLRISNNILALSTISNSTLHNSTPISKRSPRNSRLLKLSSNSNKLSNSSNCNLYVL